MGELDFIYKRHSIRRFKDIEIPDEDINEIIKAATYAPSGNNIQNWHFVVVKNKKIIKEMVKIVEDKNKELSENIPDEDMKQRFRRYVKYHTVFRNAPVVILIFCGPYDITGLDFIKANNTTMEELIDFQKPDPAIQNIGAAMENLQLAATAKGYGACWMTGPSYARKELEKLINLDKEGYFLAAMTPLGVPEDGDIKSPPRKPLEEVMTVIE
ncbi:nitroreductase family protein [Defluviitalea phaphyphila]|uniref:nitroreductase family protein n=1 Tax=Defluviitalea phaphyphila TaxID=1473580 RepID=UPI000730D29C|nr:nitroreductase family protein [Defluviitalea phaphyphila]